MDPQIKNALITPPRQLPWWIRLGAWITKKVTGKELLPPKILAWYPRVAFSSGVMEALVTHQDKTLSKRILKLVRMQASHLVNCPFCIDMNSHQYREYQISEAELAAIQGLKLVEAVETFSQREQLALLYARFISATPLYFPDEFMERMKDHFSERELVILASTAAQVNYWARLLQGLGVPSAGFLDDHEAEQVLKKG